MQKTSLKKNFIMNAILTMSSFIFPISTFPYVTRVLLPTGTGKVALAVNLIVYFNMIAQLGIPIYGIRACAKVRDNRDELTRTTHELLAINLIMAAVAYILLALALIFVPRLRSERVLYIIVSSTIFLSAIGMEWLYKALEQYTYIAIRSVTFKLFALLAMFLLVRSQDDYVIYGAITVLASSASYILNLLNARKYIGFRSVGGYSLKRHWKMAAVFFAMACATTIYCSLNTVVLGFMKTDADVGYYDAAIKIKKVLVTVVTSLGAVILPRSSYYIEHNMKDEFTRITRKALNFVVLLAAPLSVYFIIFSEDCILFLSGKAYEAAVIPMTIVMPTVLLIGISNILGIQILVPTEREKVVLRSEIIGALVDLIVCIALIPSMSTTGAALGTLSAEMAVLAVQFYALRTELAQDIKGIHYLRILTAIAIASACSIWVMFVGVGYFATLAISAVLFFGIYGAFLLAVREELVTEIFNQIFRLLKHRRDGA